MIHSFRAINNKDYKFWCYERSIAAQLTYTIVYVWSIHSNAKYITEFACASWRLISPAGWSFLQKRVPTNSGFSWQKWSVMLKAATTPLWYSFVDENYSKLDTGIFGVCYFIFYSSISYVINTWPHLYFTYCSAVWTGKDFISHLENIRIKFHHDCDLHSISNDYIPIR